MSESIEHAPHRTMKFGKDLLAKAFRFYAAGSSTHAVARELSLTMDDAEEILRIYVDTNRSRFAPDRIAKRQAMRHKLGTAAGFLESVYSGTHPAFTGKDPQGKELDPGVLRNLQKLLGLQVKAASAVMSAGRVFASESLLDLLVERAQEEAEEAQPTIFEMEIIPGAKGGATIVHMPTEAERRTGT